MPPRLKPRKFLPTNRCTNLCTLGTGQRTIQQAELIHSWYESGCNDPTIVENARKAGFKLSQGAVQNHRAKHIVPADLTEPLPDEPDPSEKLSDLQILDRIIQAGSKQINGKTVRISPEMTMRAMELRLKLTQGSVFDDFMGAVAKAFGAENPEAQRSDDEVDPDGSDDEPG